MPLTKDPAEIITVTFDFSSDATAVSNPAVSIDVVAGKLDPSASAMPCCAFCASRWRGGLKVNSS